MTYYNGIKITPTKNDAVAKIGVIIDGKIANWDESKFGNVKTTNNHRIVLPIAILVTKLGYEITWENETQTITIFKSKKDENDKLAKNNIIFQLGSTKINTPTGIVEIDIPAVAIDNRSYVSLQFVENVLGLNTNFQRYDNVDGGKQGNKYFYVTIDTSDNQKLTTKQKVDLMGNKERQQFYSNNPAVNKVIEEIGELTWNENGRKKSFLVDNKVGTILIGTDSPLNQTTALLRIDTTSDDEIKFYIRDWNMEICKITTKKLLKIWFPKDAQYIYKQLYENWTYKLGEWWTAPNGTVVKGEQDGTLYIQK